MSWIKRRPWLACFLLAAGLRVPAAFIIQAYPVFPSYYYEDARHTDEAAWEIARTGIIPADSAPFRAHAFATAQLYRVVGHRPALAGALAGVACAAGIAYLAFSLAPAFGLWPALAAGAATALWPSCIFFTAQNLKEPWVMAFGFLGLGLLGRLLRGEAGVGQAAAAIAALMVCGFLRSYALAAVALACLLAATLALKQGRAAALAVVAVLAAAGLYKGVGNIAYAGPLSAPIADDPEMKTGFIPTTVNPGTGHTVTLYTPEGISEFRRVRQENDRNIARTHQGREVSSQILPDARFNTWLDVVLFLPRASSHVLFMPLPGLYPMEGKIGRMLAAAENVVLLAAFALALAGLRGRRIGPGEILLLAFFAIMVCGTSVLEFDLGSASRHKILYMPMLFPFAFRRVLRS